MIALLGLPLRSALTFGMNVAFLLSSLNLRNNKEFMVVVAIVFF